MTLLSEKVESNKTNANKVSYEALYEKLGCRWSRLEFYLRTARIEITLNKKR